MSKPEDWAFAFEEADHLTRIHLKLALEDVGFEVAEADDVIAIAGAGSPGDLAAPLPGRAAGARVGKSGA